MENILNLLPFILTALGGQIVHVLSKLSKLEKEKNFLLSVWMHKNMYTTLLGFVAAIIGVVVFSDKMTYELSLVSGYAIDSIVKNGKTAVDKSKK